MKSLLEKELRLLAQEILDIKNDEDLSLCHEKARLLYEKLTVMIYTGHHSSGADVYEKEDIDIVVPSTDSIEEATPLCQADEAEEIKEEEAPSIPPVIEEETTVAETVEDTPAVKDSPTTEEIKEESNVMEEVEPLKEEGNHIEEEIRHAEKKKQRKASKSSDIFQQSLFDQDLFSSQIIGFDPDEDLFEKASSVEKVAADDVIAEETAIEESVITEEKPYEIEKEDVEEEAPTPEDLTEEDNDDSTARLIDEIIDSPIKTDAAPVNEKKSFFSFRIMEEDSDDEEEDKSTHTADDDLIVEEETIIEESVITEEKPDVEEKEETAEENIIEDTIEAGVEEEVAIEEDTIQESTTDDVIEVAEDIEEEEVVMAETAIEEPIDDLKEDVEETTQEAPMTINEALAQNSSSSGKISVNEMLATKNIAISLNDRLAFINNLFDGEVEDFENTIRYIFSQKEVDVVIEYITEIIKPYYNNWIEKEEYEKRFMEIILKYFA
ncbi:MAG: hypothetical protein IKT29_05155 [Flavobacteriales bacterium]|nr:hypothetical protein [Flavobacteriales bacterium]